MNHRSMNHSEATGLLVEFADGILDDVTHAEMENHVVACEDCQSWLRTFTLLSHVPKGSHQDPHPDSLDLAKCSARPGEEFEPDHSVLRSHLASCETCREDLDTVRRAVMHARPGADTHAASPFTPARKTTWWWATAAATGMVGLAIGALVGSGIYPTGPDGTTSHDRGEAVAATDTSHDISAVAHASIEGERLIRSEGQITIANTSILPGASVTIQARRGVSFGNGFQVGSGTQITVGALEDNAPDMSRKRKGGRNEKG